MLSFGKGSRLEHRVPNAINADKPQFWLIDIQASVDLFNAWFMKFAPKALPGQSSQSHEACGERRFSSRMI